MESNSTLLNGEAFNGACSHRKVARIDRTDSGRCVDCGEESFPLEPFSEREEALLEKLDTIESEAKSALLKLQSGNTEFNLSECECNQCKAIAPVVAALHEMVKKNPCQCRFCAVAHAEGEQGHGGSCACKLCKAARLLVQSAQEMKGIIENG